MHTKLTATMLLAAALFLSACQSVSPREDFVSGGARLLAQEEVAALWPGSTLREVDNKWSVYYAENGNKNTQVGSEMRKRRWWVNADGAFCETLYATGKESCGPKVYESGGVYKVFDTAGQVRFEFNREQGNTSGL